jgi:hypothetical protein
MDWLTLKGQAIPTVAGAPMRVFHLEANPTDSECVHRELLRKNAGESPSAHWMETS